MSENGKGKWEVVLLADESNDSQTSRCLNVNTQVSQLTKKDYNVMFFKLRTGIRVQIS